MTGPGLDDPLLVVKRQLSGSDTITQATYPVVSDGRGQLIAVADTMGQFEGTVNTPQYDAGLWNSSGLTGHAQSFNPRRQASPAGIDTISTFRTRQYDPATGKWLQEDPAGIAGGVNLYEYNGNDPNSFSDPFGLVPPDCPNCQGNIIHPATGEIRSVPMSQDPIFAAALGVAGAITSGLAEAGTAVAEEAESMFGSPTLDRIATTGSDLTRGSSVLKNRQPSMSTSELHDALRNEGFAERARYPNGALRLAKDETRVTLYPRSSSAPHVPSAEVYVGNVKKMKIRLTSEP